MYKATIYADLEHLRYFFHVSVARLHTKHSSDVSLVGSCGFDASRIPGSTYLCSAAGMENPAILQP